MKPIRREYSITCPILKPIIPQKEFYKISPRKFIINFKNLINGSNLSYDDLTVSEMDNEQFSYYQKKVKIMIDEETIISGGMALDVYTLGKYPATDIDIYIKPKSCHKMISEIKIFDDVQYIYSPSLLTVTNAYEKINETIPKLQLIMLPEFENKNNITFGKYLDPFKKTEEAVGENSLLNKKYEPKENSFKNEILRYISLNFYNYDFNICKIAIFRMNDKYYFCRHITFDIDNPFTFDVTSSPDRIKHYIKDKGFETIAEITFYKEASTQYIKTTYKENKYYTSVRYKKDLDSVSFGKGRMYSKYYNPVTVEEMNGSLILNKFLTRYGFKHYNLSSKYVNASFKIIYDGIGDKFSEKKYNKYLELGLVEEKNSENILKDQDDYLHIKVEDNSFVIDVTDSYMIKQDELMLFDIRNTSNELILMLIETLKKIYTSFNDEGKTITFTHDKPLVIMQDFVKAFIKL